MSNLRPKVYKSQTRRKSSKRGKIVYENFNLNTVARILGAPQDIQAGIYMHKKMEKM